MGARLALAMAITALVLELAAPAFEVSCSRKAGGQSRESSDRRHGAYFVGSAEAACALYAATMASLSAFAAPLPPSTERR